MIDVAKIADLVCSNNIRVSIVLKAVNYTVNKLLFNNYDEKCSLFFTQRWVVTQIQRGQFISFFAFELIGIYCMCMGRQHFVFY